MKYLVDNQLPPALVRHLRGHGLDSAHVADVGLDHASDRELWDFARTGGYAIVSKDDDFLHLAGADPTGPPFVWVRLGNCRNAALLAHSTASCRSWFRPLMPATRSSRYDDSVAASARPPDYRGVE